MRFVDLPPQSYEILFHYNISERRQASTTQSNDCNYRLLHAPSTTRALQFQGNHLNGTGNCVPLTSRLNCAKCQMDPLNHFVARFGVWCACAANRMHRFAERRQSDIKYGKKRKSSNCTWQTVDLNCQSNVCTATRHTLETNVSLCSRSPIDVIDFELLLSSTTFAANKKKNQTSHWQINYIL